MISTTLNNKFTKLHVFSGPRHRDILSRGLFHSLLHAFLHFRFQFCLEHLYVVDGLNDDLQLCQLARLLELLWQHSPQVLHICGADVAGVQVKVSNLDTHDSVVCNVDVISEQGCDPREVQVVTVG